MRLDDLPKVLDGREGQVQNRHCQGEEQEGNGCREPPGGRGGDGHGGKAFVRLFCVGGRGFARAVLLEGGPRRAVCLEGGGDPKNEAMVGRDRTLGRRDNCQGNEQRGGAQGVWERDRTKLLYTLIGMRFIGPRHGIWRWESGNASPTKDETSHHPRSVSIVFSY